MKYPGFCLYSRGLRLLHYTDYQLRSSLPTPGEPIGGRDQRWRQSRAIDPACRIPRALCHRTHRRQDAMLMNENLGSIAKFWVRYSSPHAHSHLQVGQYRLRRGNHRTAPRLCARAHRMGWQFDERHRWQCKSTHSPRDRTRRRSA